MRPGAEGSGGVEITFKLLSVDPASYDDAPSEGIRRLLQIATNHEIGRDEILETGDIGES